MEPNVTALKHRSLREIEQLNPLLRVRENAAIDPVSVSGNFSLPRRSRGDVGCTMARATKVRLRKRRREEIHQSEAGQRVSLPGTGEYRSYRFCLSRRA